MFYHKKKMKYRVNYQLFTVRNINKAKKTDTFLIFCFGTSCIFSNNGETLYKKKESWKKGGKLYFFYGLPFRNNDKAKWREMHQGLDYLTLFY